MESSENLPFWDCGNRSVHKVNDKALLPFSPQDGEVDCWPLTCPTLSCEYTTILEGECCPRCVSDPCLADNIAYDIRKTCLDSYGLSRLSGSVWTMTGSPCTTCKCKVIGCPEETRPCQLPQNPCKRCTPEVSECTSSQGHGGNAGRHSLLTRG